MLGFSIEHTSVKHTSYDFLHEPGNQKKDAVSIVPMCTAEMPNWCIKSRILHAIDRKVMRFTSPKKGESLISVSNTAISGCKKLFAKQTLANPNQWTDKGKNFAGLNRRLMTPY